MSTIEEAEYWKTRKQVREDILAIRNELLDIVAKKSVIERRLEQMQSELAVLNSALLNEAYYLRIGRSSQEPAPKPLHVALGLSEYMLPYGSYRDMPQADGQAIQLFGQSRTVDGFRRAAAAEVGEGATHSTGRYVTDTAGKLKQQLYDSTIAALLHDDPVAFRRITTKDPEGQILIAGEFGVVPAFHERAPGRIYVDENEYYEALAQYYTYMAKLATRKSQEQHSAA